MQIRHMGANFLGPYLSNITRAACIRIALFASDACARVSVNKMFDCRVAIQVLKGLK